MFSRGFLPHPKDPAQILSDNQTIEKKPSKIHTSLLGEHLGQKRARIQTGAGGTTYSFRQLVHASKAQGETGSEPSVSGSFTKKNLPPGEHKCIIQCQTKEVKNNTETHRRGGVRGRIYKYEDGEDYLQGEKCTQKKCIIDRDKGWKLFKRDIHRKKAILTKETQFRKKKKTLRDIAQLKGCGPLNSDNCGLEVTTMPLITMDK